MNTRNRILAVALIAALVGAVVGAFAFRAPGSNTEAAATTASTWDVPSSVSDSKDAARTENGPVTASDQIAYNLAYEKGVRDARTGAVNNHAVINSSNGTTVVTRPRYVYGAPTYVQPRQRSFWDKHRDKLTVAMGAGGGALLGGLIGGKRGAGIGAIAGGGGSALYTYKIRKRNRRY